MDFHMVGLGMHLAALLIGLAQAAAIIPGTSRSGATMTAALYLGYTREAAARFSFLMSAVFLGHFLIGDFLIYFVLLSLERPKVEVTHKLDARVFSVLAIFACITQNLTL